MVTNKEKLNAVLGLIKEGKRNARNKKFAWDMAYKVSEIAGITISTCDNGYPDFERLEKDARYVLENAQLAKTVLTITIAIEAGELPYERRLDITNALKNVLLNQEYFNLRFVDAAIYGKGQEPSEYRYQERRD